MSTRRDQDEGGRGKPGNRVVSVTKCGVSGRDIYLKLPPYMSLRYLEDLADVAGHRHRGGNLDFCVQHAEHLEEFRVLDDSVRTMAASDPEGKKKAEMRLGVGGPMSKVCNRLTVRRSLGGVAGLGVAGQVAGRVVPAHPYDRRRIVAK